MLERLFSGDHTSSCHTASFPQSLIPIDSAARFRELCHAAAFPVATTALTTALILCDFLSRCWKPAATLTSLCLILKPPYSALSRRRKPSATVTPARQRIESAKSFLSHLWFPEVTDTPLWKPRYWNLVLVTPLRRLLLPL